MPKYLIAFLLFYSFASSAQEIGDIDYVFKDIEKVKQYPELVINLDLSGSKLKEIPQILFELNNLKNLDLSKNQISLLPAGIIHWEKLESLDLSKNNISNIPPQIGNLILVERLNLSKNKIRKLPIEIGRLESLIDFQIWNNQLTEIPSEIQKLAKLKVLNLRGMSIDDDNELDLKKWLPDTDIYYSYGCDCNR
jgi:Leucine-rich repeat (LRR) protein